MSTYEISKSSLLSLKAEILRKQQELVKAKADNNVKIKLIKKNTPLEIKNKGIEARQNKDLEEVDADLLKQSRSMLEAKSKLYEKLSSGKGKLSKEEHEHKARFLVRFDKKNKSRVDDLPPSDSEDEPDKYPESDDDQYQSDDDANKDPGEKWVDYTDCLGRTRICLQKDLTHIMSKDDDLKKTVEAKNKSEPPSQSLTSEKIDNERTEENEDDIIENEVTPESELLSSDMRRELLRQQWEKEEEELRQKSDVHYQDILFGEARTHGVGYYGFSKDEEERAKQQEALKKLRRETEAKQKRAQELKAMREKQLAVRIKAAKDRKRARLGLPPEEEPTPIPEKEISEEEKNKEDELKQKEAEKEKILEEARKHHVRPWDIGKEGVKTVKEHYEMTQEEWVKKKRSERSEEFAPPTSYRTEFRSTVKSADKLERSDELEDPDKSLNFTTKKSFRQKRTLHTRNKDRTEDKNGLYEEIKQNDHVQPTPIINLCDDINDFDDRLLSDYKQAMQGVASVSKDEFESSDSDTDVRRTGIEIAPPPTFDYYGPSSSKRPKLPRRSNNIEDSVEAGLRFLRKQVEEKEKSTKHPREMFLI